MQDPSNATANEPSLSIRLMFYSSFILPALYAICIQIPLEQGEPTGSTSGRLLGWGLIGTLIGSLLIPLLVILWSAQSRISKAGQCVFCVVAWLVVQFCAAMGIGFICLMHSGLNGIQ